MAKSTTRASQTTEQKSKTKAAPKAGLNARAVQGKPAPKKLSSSKAVLNKKSPPKELSADERQRMIELAAYHVAERDGFKPGLEQDYWLQGEKQINDLLGDLFGAQTGSSTRSLSKAH